MSDEEKIYKLPDALEKKGIILKCPICSGDKFSVSEELKKYVIPAINKDRDFSINYDLGSPVYSIVCRRCSYVLNFSIPIAEMIVDGIPTDN